MILEQITQEVSNRSFSKHNFNEINNSINIISESKKPTKKPKPKTQKNNFKKKEPSLTKKIAEEELQKKKTPNKKTKKTKKSKDLNETIEVVKDELEELKLIYGQLESEYNTAGVDYESLFSYLSHKANNFQDYLSTQDTSNPYSLVISDQEAAELMEKVAISTLIGDKDSTSYKEREKIGQWVTLNKTLCSLYEVLSPIKNRNIDYSKLN